MDRVKLEQEMVASFLRAANPSDHKQLCILMRASEMTKQEWQKLHEDMVYSFLDKCDLDDFWPVFSQLVRMQMKFNVQLREN